MKKLFVISFISLLPLIVEGQTIKQIDSVTIQMCRTLSELPEMKSQEKFDAIMNKHLPDFYRLAKISSQQQADTINNRIFFRLQRNCSEFTELLKEIEPSKSDWKTLDEKPLAKISTYDYNEFLKGGNFYYLENSGEIVRVKINKNQWIETFEDGTISKLILQPIDNAAFNLKFIESDNVTRKNLSVKGDIYNYNIYAKDENSYDIWIPTNDNVITAFKLYIEKMN